MHGPLGSLHHLFPFCHGSAHGPPSTLPRQHLPADLWATLRVKTRGFEPGASAESGGFELGASAESGDFWGGASAESGGFEPGASARNAGVRPRQLGNWES